jgi:nicotinate-nucleotide pyrophosphorylase
MLRQTLEYELTLLRTQHGKQTAFTHQVQNQLNQANEQIKQLQQQLTYIQQQKDQQIKEKDQIIKQLENEAETLHDRERFSLFYYFQLNILLF